MTDRRARSIGDLDTPVALVDIARLEANLAAMAAVAREAGVAQRPHAKTHKTREIAERQLAHGAIGLTVAKLGEAEVMVDAGFDDLFVAYPLVGEIKLTRLVALLDRAKVRFEVDTPRGRAGGLGLPRSARAAGRRGRQRRRRSGTVGRGHAR